MPYLITVSQTRINPGTTRSRTLGIYVSRYNSIPLDNLFSSVIWYQSRHVLPYSQVSIYVSRYNSIPLDNPRGIDLFSSVIWYQSRHVLPYSQVSMFQDTTQSLSIIHEA